MACGIGDENSRLRAASLRPCSTIECGPACASQAATRSGHACPVSTAGRHTQAACPGPQNEAPFTRQERHCVRAQSFAEISDLRSQMDNSRRMLKAMRLGLDVLISWNRLHGWAELAAESFVDTVLCQLECEAECELHLHSKAFVAACSLESTTEID